VSRIKGEAVVGAGVTKSLVVKAVQLASSSSNATRAFQDSPVSSKRADCGTFGLVTGWLEVLV
jgi:hypothetical protein